MRRGIAVGQSAAKRLIAPDGRSTAACSRPSTSRTRRGTPAGRRRSACNCLSPRNSSIWLKRFVANDESSTVVPIARVQVPVYDHWYRERSAEWIRSAGSVAAYVQSLTYSRNVMPLVRKKKRSFEEALKSSRKPVLLALRRIGLAAAVEVVGRLLAVLDEVLIRLGHHPRVQVHQRVLVGAVRVEDAIARDDVVREGIADHAVRVRRIRTRRQRIVDLVLRRIGQPQQVREVALQVLLVGRYGERPLDLPGDRVVGERVVGEVEQFAAAVHEPGNPHRAAGGQRQVVRAALLELALRAVVEGRSSAARSAHSACSSST